MRKSRKVLVLVAALGLLLSLSGITYAYLRARKDQESTNQLTLLKCLGVDYEDKTNAVSINNAYPVSDEEGMKTNVYTFKISNKCNTNVYAKVNLETLTSDEPIGLNHIKVWFDHEYLDNPKLGLLSNTGIFKREDVTLAAATQSNNLTEINLGAYESTEFNLRLWIDKETTWEEGGGKTYAGKITVSVSPNPNTSVVKGDLTMYAYVDGVISSSFPTSENYHASVTCNSFSDDSSDVVSTVTWSGTKWLVNVASMDSGDTVCNVYFTQMKDSEVQAPNGWYSAKEGTLLAAIRSTNNLGSPATNPGSEVSVSSEAVLASTADDYGTSFYFRGNVQNNYVTFANMCWRIVRVTGDGSIKLVLYNRNDNNITNPCNETGSDLAFATYSGTTYKTNYNPDYGDNAYVGFMYGSTKASEYVDAHANRVKSTVLTNLEAWYTSKISAYEDKLADTIWCNDKSIASGTGAGTSASNYGAYSRYNGSTATLICPEDKEGGKLSKITVSDTINGNGALTYKIGLLTADEIVYAGLKWGATNSNSNYLKENVASSTSWWSMSPYALNVGFSDTTRNLGNVIVATGAGAVANQRVNNSYALRPSLSLKSTITILNGGNGTTENPFVVSS